MALQQADIDVFEEARGRLEAVAYRLLGSASEAEDAVQEAFIRWQAADRDRIQVPQAWLTKVVTNLCLNQLTSARSRRETYVGQWLPEPLLDGDPMLGPAETAEQRESVSFAVLRLMEQLSPTERAVYVLREAFGYSHSEIAQILESTESASQQALSRARRGVDDGRTRTKVDPATARAIADEFLTAALSGRVEPLVSLLTNDAMGIGDGGGKVPARPTPIHGAMAVAKFLRGLAAPSQAKRAYFDGRTDLHLSSANGSPAVVMTADDHVAAVMVIDVVDGRIAGVLNQANPDKVTRLARRWETVPHEEPFLRGW